MMIKQKWDLWSFTRIFERYSTAKPQRIGLQRRLHLKFPPCDFRCAIFTAFLLLCCDKRSYQVQLSGAVDAIHDRNPPMHRMEDSNTLISIRIHEPNSTANATVVGPRRWKRETPMDFHGWAQAKILRLKGSENCRVISKPCPMTNHVRPHGSPVTTRELELHLASCA